MYIRSKTVKDRRYYEVVESYRDEAGQPRNRRIAALGPHATIAAAIKALEALAKDDAPQHTRRGWNTLTPAERRRRVAELKKLDATMEAETKKKKATIRE